ncbi:MAG: hypothetical protein KDJ54_14630 [Candidatus Competibacteraceae bacterium]|nr:hypothetical protein [Candidatus Competibacteraceae bacterium]
MPLNQVVKEVEFSSRHGRQRPQENTCIQPIILDVGVRYKARRIFCMRCGNRKPDPGGQEAGCAVGKECGGNGMANSHEWMSMGGSRWERVGCLARMEDSDVSMIVNPDINDSYPKAATLIESANQRLCPNDILMITLPVRGHWETLWSAVGAWWDRWNGSSDAQCWSWQRLSALLESHGFTILESIKVKTLSKRRHAIVLVARKTGEPNPRSTKCSSPV